MGSATETFETILEDARDALAAAQVEYDALESTESVPTPVINALSDFGRELDQLDDRLTVEQEDLEAAKATASRISTLKSVLSALREHQRLVVEADVTRLRYQVDLLDQLGVETETEDAVTQYSMLQKLVDRNRHDRVYGNDRLSPGTIERDLRAKRFARASEVSDTVSRDAHRETAAEVLEDVHEYLGDLPDENEDRTAFAADLGQIKGMLSDDNDASGAASIAFEGCLMLHHGTSRAYATQQMTEALADAVTDAKVDIAVDIEDGIACGAADELLDGIATVLASATEQSTATRLQQLIEQHDGSVERTAAATEFGVAEILDHIATLHADGAIADITVHFDS